MDEAELADDGPVRATVVIRPHGYALWERLQVEVDACIERAGAEAARTGFWRIAWRTLGVDGEAGPTRNAVTVRCLPRPDGSLPEADDEDDLVAVVAWSR